MTLEEYEKLPYTIIKFGYISNSPSGCFMTRDKDLPMLKYAVVKRTEGWVVYFGRPQQTWADIKLTGDKSNTEEYIRRCFPCTDEMFKLYAL
ncbi:hypothetical protein LCGC14_2978910 [marine sediment metagenome]|uniref:Uncharacterized protein n=1 Tax=marine sediment metagenome TaxID=412755 RepID=A0A0F8ZER8_9ZZZZ